MQIYPKTYKFSLQSIPIFSKFASNMASSTFAGPSSTGLLDLVIKLREKGVGKYINLPQIVVVGDQSSGKSSLLEGLTGQAFPRSDGLCTRFATELTFRRDASLSQDVITVSAVKAKDMLNNEIPLAAEFPSRQYENLDAEVFESVYEEAATAFGIPKPGEDDDGSRGASFSDHVLRIEISGPNHPLLTIVDVPGLIKKAVKHQSNSDIELVRNLVLKYVKESRSIIVAVIPANVDVANQEVLSIAEQYDPKGERTLGVITKPDLVDPGTEHQVIRMARGELIPMKLGYFVVRSRNAKELKEGTSNVARDSTERMFFSKDPWNQLPSGRAGTSYLKGFLEILYMKHIRSHMPSVLNEIEDRLKACKDQLSALGPATKTPDEQRHYLITVANRAKIIIEDALCGNYERGKLARRADLRLRNAIHILNEKLAKSVNKSVKVWKFEGESDNYEHEELDEAGNSVVKERIVAIDRIRIQYRNSRGKELPGIPNSEAIIPLFSEITESWPLIIEKHVRDVWKVVEAFVDQVIELSCYDKDMLERLKRRLRPLYAELLQTAKHELGLILEDERSGDILLTYNDQYAQNVNVEREARAQRNLAKMDFILTNDQDDLRTMFSRLLFANSPSNEDEAVHQIHDCLKSYVTIACSRISDNVALQVVERRIMRALPKVFDADLVFKWTVNDLEAVAGEDPLKVQKRAQLEGEKKSLEEGKEEIYNGGYF